MSDERLRRASLVVRAAGQLLAGCGVLFFGVAALIYVVDQGRFASEHDRWLVDDAERLGQEMFLNELRRVRESRAAPEDGIDKDEEDGKSVDGAQGNQRAQPPTSRP